MKLGNLIPVLFIFVGAFFLLLALINSMKIRENVPKEVKKKWLLSSGLMIFFLVGYIISAIFLMISIKFPLELISGIIFFGGGLFVFIIISLAKTTISSIEEKEIDLWLSREKLRKRSEEIENLKKTE